MNTLTKTYLVTADANDLEGWNVDSLAAALRAPLGELGIQVETASHQYNGGGLSGASDDWGFASQVDHIVERIIADGPAA